jgi:hypothetical protein
MSSQQACPEDFELDDGYEPLAVKTLEEVIADGESEWEQQQEKDWVTLNNEPQWLHSVIVRGLKGKHKNVPTASAAERLVLKRGIAAIRERFEGKIREIERLWSRIFNAGNQLSLMKSYKTTAYEPQETAATTYRKCSARRWVAGAINDNLVDPLGLSTTTAVIVTLIAGVSVSEKWVPEPWKRLAEKELRNFEEYLDAEIQKLRAIIADLAP